MVATALVTAAASHVPFNKEASRLLGVWLDSHLTLRSHHAVWLIEGKKEIGMLRWFTGQTGLSPTNCRKVMTACVWSAAMFGSELWWERNQVRAPWARQMCWSTRRRGLQPAASGPYA